MSAAVELNVRNWTKFNVRAACRPLESGQWIQTLAPDIPPTANSKATVRISEIVYRILQYSFVCIAA